MARSLIDSVFSISTDYPGIDMRYDSLFRRRPGLTHDLRPRTGFVIDRHKTKTISNTAKTPAVQHTKARLR